MPEGQRIRLDVLAFKLSRQGGRDLLTITDGGSPNPVVAIYGQDNEPDVGTTLESQGNQMTLVFITDDQELNRGTEGFVIDFVAVDAQDQRIGDNR